MLLKVEFLLVSASSLEFLFVRCRAVTTFASICMRRTPVLTEGSIAEFLQLRWISHDVWNGVGWVSIFGIGGCRDSIRLNGAVPTYMCTCMFHGWPAPANSAPSNSDALQRSVRGVQRLFCVIFPFGLWSEVIGGSCQILDSKKRRYGCKEL